MDGERGASLRGDGYRQATDVAGRDMHMAGSKDDGGGFDQHESEG